MKTKTIKIWTKTIPTRKNCKVVVAVVVVVVMLFCCCVRTCTNVYECVLISDTHHHHQHCRYTEELYVLSNKEKDRFSSKYLTMTTKVNRISIRGCKAMTGIVANRANSRAVRDLLLLEMVVRSLKGLFRLYMRGCTRMYGVTSEQVRSNEEYCNNRCKY